MKKKTGFALYPENINKKGRPHGRNYPLTQKKIQEIAIGILSAEVSERVTLAEAYIKNLLKTATADPNSVASKIVAERLLSPNFIAEYEKTDAAEKTADIDYLCYRIHRKAFGIQQNILVAKGMLLLMAGRRAGKTECNGMLITQTLISKTAGQVLYIGKTFETAMAQMWARVVNHIDALSVDIVKKDAAKGTFTTADGCTLYVKGNSTSEEAEKLRGGFYDLVIIDEVQSQRNLKYLVEDIVEPMLLDRKGQLVLSGTGPRVRGSYWEDIWLYKNGVSRYNWSITDNPYIPDHTTVLAKIRADKGLTESSPLYMREYLGKIAYDDDALVCRLTDANYYTQGELDAWIAAQRPADLRIVSGLDYGYASSTASAVIVWSISDRKKWIVREYKQNRKGVSEVIEEIQAQSEEVKKYNAPDNRFFVYADTSHGQISYEMATNYKLPVLDAYKQNKGFAIEMLQEEVRTGNLLVMRDGVFDDEAKKTIFARNDKDELTREIDDAAYHPDLVFAVLYALRPVWLEEGRDDRG